MGLQPEQVLLLVIPLFSAMLIYNLRRHVKYHTSIVPSLISALLVVWAVLLYLNLTAYAILLFAIIALISIIFLPSAWKDWAKILKHEKESEPKLRDYLTLRILVRLSYRFGRHKAALLYALKYSAVFAITFILLGELLSLKYYAISGIIAAAVIFPINYHLASKTLKALEA